MSDKLEETWHNFIQGDQSAFNDLYKQHYLGLINYGTKWTGDRSRANDYIIEMLLGLWDKRATLPEVKNVRSYLLTCARTFILQKLRSDKVHESKINHLYTSQDQHELSYEDYMIKIQSDSDLKRKLTQCLNKLTDRQKELLQYRYFDNMDYDEIALTCNITKRTAYNIVHDALKILKESMKGSEISKEFLLFLLFSSVLLNY
jgi:RNA polymerase sigma factor (sigma-70 family)